MQQVTHPQRYGLPETGFIRAKDLVPLLPFSRSVLWDMSAAGDFPKGYKLTQGITAWSCEEVIAWFDERVNSLADEQSESPA